MTDHNLFVKNPLQYLDGEVNASHKDFEAAKARVALVFPDLYELGMSHLGLKILYEILNAREGFLAERAFAPWTDRDAQLRRLGIPLGTLESGRPLGDFDLVGFTLPYELTYTNILNILDLAGIPLWRAERDDRHPLVEAEPGLHATLGEERGDRLRAVLSADLLVVAEGDPQAALGREAVRDEALAEMGAQESGSSGDHRSGHESSLREHAAAARPLEP